MADTAEGAQSMRFHENGRQLTEEEAAFLKKYLLESPQTIITGNENPQKRKQRDKKKSF